MQHGHESLSGMQQHAWALAHAVHADDQKESRAFICIHSNCSFPATPCGAVWRSYLHRAVSRWEAFKDFTQVASYAGSSSLRTAGLLSCALCRRQRRQRGQEVGAPAASIQGLHRHEALRVRTGTPPRGAGGPAASPTRGGTLGTLGLG